MRRLNKKAAVELSVSFIVILVISSVIVVGGLGLFFKMKNNAQNYVDKLDSQTQDNLKSMMLSKNYDIAVFPQDIVLTPKDAKMVGVGIKNNYDYEGSFKVDLLEVKKFLTPESEGTTVLSSTANENMRSKYRQVTDTPVKIAPGAQGVKGILLMMPEDAGSDKAEYVYTLKIKNSTTEYGKIQVYVKNG